MIYSQRDTKWRSEKLGTGSTTIGGYGCTITALAQLLLLNGHEETPSTVNQKLISVNGYAGTNKNLIIWTAIEKCLPAKHVERLYSYSNVKATKAIEENKGVLIEVDGTKIGAPKHWILYIGNGKALDPWTGTEISTSYYPAIGMSIIQVKENEMDFIDLKKRLIDKHWFELTEFEELRKRKLIDRADSIQTQTQKWLKSDAGLRAEVEILVKMKKEAENALQEATEGHKKAVEQAKAIEERFTNYKMESEVTVKELQENLETCEDTFKNMKKEMKRMSGLLERCEAKNLQEYTVKEALNILISSITKWLKN